jgi:hypothetical protein
MHQRGMNAGQHVTRVKLEFEVKLIIVLSFPPIQINVWKLAKHSGDKARKTSQKLKHVLRYQKKKKM